MKPPARSESRDGEVSDHLRTLKSFHEFACERPTVSQSNVIRVSSSGQPFLFTTHVSVIAFSCRIKLLNVSGATVAPHEMPVCNWTNDHKLTLQNVQFEFGLRSSRGTFPFFRKRRCRKPFATRNQTPQFVRHILNSPNPQNRTRAPFPETLAGPRLRLGLTSATARRPIRAKTDQWA
jgi:hypothetical protein